MKNITRTLLICILIMAMIIGAFRLAKGWSEVLIKPGDLSMSPGYPPANYKVETSFSSILDLKQSDVVAYYLSSAPEKYRVGRIAALEGNRVKIEKGQVLINGAVSSFQLNDTFYKTPEFRVPRGCVYVLSDNPYYGVDSRHIGPIPFCQIIGRL